MPAISVLIPCYNVVNTVDETISSLVDQTLTDFEAVLVDDGSADGTFERLNEWSKRDPRIRFLALPHAGIIPALNAGLDACRSNFIARLDADDRAMPDRLERQAAMLGAHPELALVSSLVRGFPADSLGAEFQAYILWLNTLLTDQDIKESMFSKSPLAHPSVTYRREWVERAGGYQDHGWAEDYDLWVRLFLAGANFGKVPEVLLEWRDHPRRLTHTDSRYSPSSDVRLQAHYLLMGPLAGSRQVIIIGTSAAARELADDLLRRGCPLDAYVDIRNTLKPQPVDNIPMLTADEFLARLDSGYLPRILLAGDEKVRAGFIIQQFNSIGLRQGIDWWIVGK